MNRLDRRAFPKGRQSGAEDAALETGPAPRAGAPPKAWTFLGSKMCVRTSPPGRPLGGAAGAFTLHPSPGAVGAHVRVSSP